MINNLNLYKILILKEIVCVFQIEETQLNNLGSIKKESEYFATQRDFCRDQRS